MPIKRFFSKFSHGLCNLTDMINKLILQGFEIVESNECYKDFLSDYKYHCQIENTRKMLQKTVHFVKCELDEFESCNDTILDKRMLRLKSKLNRLEASLHTTNAHSGSILNLEQRTYYHLKHFYIKHPIISRILLFLLTTIITIYLTLFAEEHYNQQESNQIEQILIIQIINDNETINYNFSY